MVPELRDITVTALDYKEIIMKLELVFKSTPQAGEVFTVNSDGNLTPYMFVESRKSDDGDLTPCKIINLHTGIVESRSTSWGLCLRDMGTAKGNITFRGIIKETI